VFYFYNDEPILAGDALAMLGKVITYL
jgi:hypothetical protein